MATRICVNYSLLFLVLWSGIASWLLTDQGWSASESGTVAALGLGYLVGGLLCAVVFSAQILWETRQPARRVLKLRTTARRASFMPAMVSSRAIRRR